MRKPPAPISIADYAASALGHLAHGMPITVHLSDNHWESHDIFSEYDKLNRDLLQPLRPYAKEAIIYPRRRVNLSKLDRDATTKKGKASSCIWNIRKFGMPIGFGAREGMPRS
jgi:hypothetical protein